MKVNKWVAVLAAGSMLALVACNAPSNEETKVDVKDAEPAVAAVPVETKVSPAPPIPTPSTLAGRWVPVEESCKGDEGVSERMIEFDGRAMISAFSSCEFPTAISSRAAYDGSMSCASEGDETDSAVSIAIQQNGTMLWRDGEGSSAYKKCSPAPRFPNE